MRAPIAVIAAVGLLSACSPTTTITAMPTSSPGRLPTATASATSPSTLPSPDTHAVDAACATLTVHLNILAKELKGKSPITGPVVEEFALAAKQIDKATLALERTQAGSDLKQLAQDAQDVADYNGTNIGELLDRVTAFANDARDFYSSYCELL